MKKIVFILVVVAAILAFTSSFITSFSELGQLRNNIFGGIIIVVSVICVALRLFNGNNDSNDRDNNDNNSEK